MYPFNIVYEKYSMVQISLNEADKFLSLLVAYNCCTPLMYRYTVCASFVVTLGPRTVDIKTKCETLFA